MTTRVRFAPSPTGPLHIGGARTALFNYLFARSMAGDSKFIIRIDDTDPERCDDKYISGILDDLQWLGLSWDGILYQSSRTLLYKETVNLLDENYACYVDEEGVTRLKPWGPDQITIPDLIIKKSKPIDALQLNDMALLRSNGTPTYHLATVTDDLEMEITHIIRGQDHFVNTANHLMMMCCLQSIDPSIKIPHFAHIPLVLTKEGKKYSKRNVEQGSLVTVKDFRDAGYSPEALVNFLALMGWSHPKEKETLSMTELIDNFSLERVNKAPAKMFTTKLDYLNKWHKKNIGQ